MTKSRIVFMFLMLLLLAGCSGQPSVISDDINDSKLTDFLRKDMANINKISQKHFGIDAVHDCYVINGVAVIDLNDKGFNYSTLTVDKQIEIMIDQIRLNRTALKDIGVHYVRILIDGNFYKLYDM